MPRFVILAHDHPEPHWDLMFECGQVLLTWRLAALPREKELIDAVKIVDHRLAYLDYEGPIRGGRGCVVRVEQGTYAERISTPDQLEVHLDGERLRGRLLLERIDACLWSCSFAADVSS